MIVDRSSLQRLSVVGAVLLVLVAGCARSADRPASTAADATESHSQVGSSPSPALAAVCSASDLEGPKLTGTPAPTVITHTLTLLSGPNLEQLSPPGGRARVTAAEAWSVLTNGGLNRPAASGAVQLLLGDLYALTPARESQDGANAQPIYTHTLVWALYGQRQPVHPIGGPAPVPGGPAPMPGTPAASRVEPPCFFETVVSYLDATTDQLLFTEVF